MNASALQFIVISTPSLSLIYEMTCEKCGMARLPCFLSQARSSSTSLCASSLSSFLLYLSWILTNWKLNCSSGCFGAVVGTVVRSVATYCFMRPPVVGKAAGVPVAPGPMFRATLSVA